MPPVPGVAVIMHCSRDEKMQVMASSLPWY
jgi:hypothetical protein